jgi:Icc-related predicted phosphoesterase
MDQITKLWFITDIHGSNICFRKFLNAIKSKKNPDVMIIGADICGKYLVPIIKQSMGGWKVEFEGHTSLLESEGEVQNYENYLADRGAYGYRCDPDFFELLKTNQEIQNEIKRKVRIERLTEWVELADKRLNGTERKIFVNGGNDDPWYIDEILDQSKVIIRPEGKAIELDKYITMISTGYSNITPWNCPRDITEEVMKEKIETMVNKISDFSKCIFNFHCPPYNTLLDLAPKLDENFKIIISGLGSDLVPVGSVAVREAIEQYQPIVGLHGHIHEQHAYEYIGNTLCFNPGSEYSQGLLRGVYLEFNQGELKQYGLTRESN